MECKKQSVKENKYPVKKAALVSKSADIRKNVRDMGIGKCGKVRDVWDKPVSKSFYEKLRAKVEMIVSGLGYVRGYTDVIMKYLDLYIEHGEVPKRTYCEEYVMAIFFSLRCDVDEAVRRSAAARQRAAERRARKAVEKNPVRNRQDSAGCHCNRNVDETALKSADTLKEKCGLTVGEGSKREKNASVTTEAVPAAVNAAVNMADNDDYVPEKKPLVKKRRRGRSSYCPL